VELRAQTASAPCRSTTATDDSHDSGSHASIFASGENQMEKKTTEFLRLDGLLPDRGAASRSFSCRSSVAAAGVRRGVALRALLHVTEKKS
jgi:hypothetical protein